MQHGCFLNCSKLSTITLNPNLYTISDNAFSYCNLCSVTIPANVTNIGTDAFNHNPELSVITFEGNKDNIKYEPSSFEITNKPLLLNHSDSQEQKPNNEGIMANVIRPTKDR